MPRRPWRLEGRELVHPTGRRIPLDAIDDWVMALWGGNQTIQTDRWRGWRIVQQYLVPPFKTLNNSGLHINNILALAFQVEAGIEDRKRVLRARDAARKKPGQ
jgi:hypothetical protein